MCALHRKNFVSGLTSRDVSQCQQLLLFARKDPQFEVNVSRLEKPALEATLSLLVLKFRQKESGGTGLDTTDRAISMDKVFELVEQNHLILQKDHECLKLLLNILALAAMLEEESAAKFESFVDKVQSIFFELPVFYEILRTLLLVAQEQTKLQDGFRQLKACVLVKNLHSNSHYIRMKSLECLQLLLNFNPEVVNLWHEVIEDDWYIAQEHRIFMLCHLVETVVQKQDEDSIQRIVKSTKIWELIRSSCESEDQLSRKQALSIIKNVVASSRFIKNPVTIDLFKWNQPDAKKLTEEWHCFVTIVEALNELQTHLVMPSLPLIEKLSQIGEDWKSLILTLILKHENLAVCSWGIDYMLESNKLLVVCRSELDNLMLQALNKTMVGRFQEFEKTKSLLVRYYRGTIDEKSLNTLISGKWKPVLLLCISEVLDHLLDADAAFHDLVSNCELRLLLDQCLEVKNLNLRFLASLQLSHIVLKLSISRTIPLNSAMTYLLPPLERVIQHKFTQFEEWNQVQSLIDDDCFEDLLSWVSSTEDNTLIRYVLVPYLQNERTSTELRLKQIVKQDLLLAIRILHYDGNLSFSEAELKSNLESLLQDFTQDTDTKITLKSLAILKKVAQNVHLLPLIEDINQRLAEILRQRLDELKYTSPDIAVTVQLVHLFVLLEQVDMVDLFFATFSLDELIKTSEMHRSRHSLYESAASTVSDIFLFRLRCHSGDVSVKKRIVEDYSKLMAIGDAHVLFNTKEMVSFMFENKMINLNEDSEFDRLQSVISHGNKCVKEYPEMMNSFVDILLAPCVAVADSQARGTNRWMNTVVSNWCEFPLPLFAEWRIPANVIFEKVLLLPIETLLDWNLFGSCLFFGLLFGKAHEREQRIVDEACKASNFFATSLFNLPIQLQADGRIRVLCVLFLYRLANPSHPDATLFLLKLERMLVEEFLRITKAKERYYADSETHRQKLRIIQALCVVFKLTGTKPYSLLEVVLYETNQPNINYLIELILADSSIDTLTIINSLKNDKVKVSGVQSVFIILWLRCCKTKYLDAEYIYFLLPWTMAQNFSTRLYAQIIIAKLLEKFYDKPDKAEHCPFSNIYSAVISYRKTGNAEKNLEKCTKDFRFNSMFDYDNLLTLENVFHNIPKVSGMAAEDVFDTKILKECFEALQLDVVNLGVAVEFEEVAAGEKKENMLLNQNCGGSDHIQKKIVPLKCLMPTEDLLADIPQNRRLKKDFRFGMIVVASLVNRLPNLGGLARSSEVFGVKQFIVNSLKDLENKEFQALSMTAEKWLNVAELKSFQIVDYLREMKSKGYQIVGAEQTTGSRLINEVCLPQNSILVLGHEKEGLPAHIISHLDIIVEIPQYGVVRSLNVHVAGAIIMHRYATQHFNSNDWDSD